MASRDKRGDKMKKIDKAEALNIVEKRLEQLTELQTKVFSLLDSINACIAYVETSIEDIKEKINDSNS